MQSKPKSLIIKIKTEGEIFVFPVEELDTMVTHTYYCWKRIVLINSYHIIFSRWWRRGTKWWHKGHVFAVFCRNFTVKVINVHSIRFLTVRKHLLPLGKALSVKCRSLGKYQLLILLAKALVKAGHIAIEGSNINYQNLTRTEVNVITDIESLISDGEESQDSCSANDVVNDSQVS